MRGVAVLCVAVLYLAAAMDCAGSRSASRLSSSPAAAPATAPAVTVDMVAPSHLEIMTFYDFNATAQHGWATGNVYPGQMGEWQQAWDKWKMPGMWNLEYFRFSGPPGKQPENFWNRHCVAGVWDCGLRPGWEAALRPALKKLAPLVGNGLTGVFLGDEMMLAGISAANITAAADFIRAALGSKAKIYWNGEPIANAYPHPPSLAPATPRLRHPPCVVCWWLAQMDVGRGTTVTSTHASTTVNIIQPAAGPTRARSQPRSTG